MITVDTDFNGLYIVYDAEGRGYGEFDDRVEAEKRAEKVSLELGVEWQTTYDGVRL